MEKAAIIIVTYNSSETIHNCLESLKNFSGDIVVVDNQSEDNTVEIVEKNKKVKLVRSEINLGFSKGCNLGAKNTDGKILIFINPDTQMVSENFEERVREDLQEDRVGIVGPKFIYPDGSIQKTTRNFPTVLNAFKEYILNTKGSYDFYMPADKSQVQTVIGAFMAMRKEVFDMVNGFDERFFLYYEDIDLCKRVNDKGFKVIFDPSIIVSHIMGVSGKGKSVSKLLIESAKKYHGFFEYNLIQILIRVGQRIYG